MQQNMMRPYAPLYAAHLGVDYLGVGTVAASVALLPILSAVWVGGLADRLGVRPLAITGSMLSSIAYFSLWAFPSLAALVLCQLAAGLANVLVVLGAQAYVGSLGRGAVAERNYGRYTIVASIGQILGPVLGGVVVGLAGYRGAFLLAVGLSSLAVVLSTCFLPRGMLSAQTTADATAEPRLPVPAQAINYLRGRATQLAILTSCLMSVPEVLRTAFIPVYLRDVQDFDASRIGYLLSVFSIAGLGAKAALPVVVRLMGRQTLLVAFTSLCAATIVIIPFIGSTVAVALCLLVMGATFGLGRPLSMAMAANAAASGELGIVIGLRITANRAADLTLPVAFGGAAALAGVAAAFPLGAGFLVCGACVLLPSMVRERRLRPET